MCHRSVDQGEGRGREGEEGWGGGMARGRQEGRIRTGSLKDRLLLTVPTNKLKTDSGSPLPIYPPEEKPKNPS